MSSVVVAAAVAVRHPWALAVVREGFPDPVWPASGEFTERGSPGTDPVDLPANRVIATDEFLADFDVSLGSAVVVARDGEIVYSHFAPGYSADTAFNSYSMVKSLVGFLVLQAISDGLIDGLDVPIGELWAEADDSPVAPVTVGELLDMRSGILFEYPTRDDDGTAQSKEQTLTTYSPLGNFARFHIEGVESVLDEIEVIDGERGRFVYQNLNTAILGRVLEEVRGTSLEDLVETEISGPAGAGGFRWRRHPSAEPVRGRTTAPVSAYCCLYATAHWWVEVADHLLDNGGDQPLLSPEWFHYFLGLDFTAEQLGSGQYRSQSRYDIFNRIGEDFSGSFIYFSGRGGQIVYLVPHEDTVIIRFGRQAQRLHSTAYQIDHFTPAP